MLPSLAAWWDSSDASTFTYSSGSVVSEWRDKSGNGRHFGQSDVSKQPSRSGTINGKATVVFDGTNDSMVSTAYAPSTPSTLLLVARNTAASGQRDAIIGAGGDGRIFRTSGDTIDFYRGAFLSTGLAWGTTAAHSVAAVSFVGPAKIAADSGAWISGGAGSTSWGSSGWRIGSASAGGAEFWQGDICEAVHLDIDITDTDVANWFAYAAAKWGTP